jgi:class 3 adenylate cyclase
LLNSKDVLEKTGISRATLNNYIGWGIVAKPQVLPPGPQDGAAPRIGYFPDDVVQRILDIQRLKSEGWSMTRIGEHFGAGKPALEPSPSAAAPAPVPSPEARRGPVPKLSANDIAAPARPANPSVERPPVLTQVAVLATELQDSCRRWCELPPEEYFELINQIWLTVDPIFKRHQGTQGKHAGDGMVCYFFPRPDCSHVWNALVAAHEMREAMRRVSKEWQLSEGWTTELYMNTGIDEGEEWLGAFKSGSRADFTMLAGTIARAARLSDFARSGAVWATKNLLGKLATDERQRLEYGVRRKNNDGEEVFVPSIFSNVDRLTDLSAGCCARLREIARLPITEIVDIAPAGKRAERTAAQDLS